MGRKKTVSDATLLDVAREAFVKEGIGASTKAIARQAGISEAVIFQRFASKDDLFFAAMIPPPASLNELLRKSRSRGRRLVEKVTLAMLEYSRATMPVLLQLMVHPGFRFEEFARRHPETAMIALRRELVQFLADQIQQGQIGSHVDPGAAALLIWSTANTIAFFEHMGAHDGKFSSEVIHNTIAAMWEGLAPSKAPERPAAES